MTLCTMNFNFGLATASSLDELIFTIEKLFLKKMLTG